MMFVFDFLKEYKENSYFNRKWALDYPSQVRKMKVQQTLLDLNGAGTLSMKEPCPDTLAKMTACLNHS